MSSGGKQTNTTSTAIDPAAMARATANYDRTLGIADKAVTPYTGQLGASLAPSVTQAQGGLAAMMGYQPQQVSTAQNVSEDQIAHYMNPYEDQVVQAAGSDIEHQRQLAQQADMGKMTAASAFGNNRRGIQDAETTGAYDRTAASTFANLRSQGFNNAVGYGQTDLARLLQAAGMNQSADLQGAGIRTNAAGQLGQLGLAETQNNQTGLNAAYAEFLRQQNDPIMKQGLLNSALAGMPVPQTTTQTSKSSPGLADYLKSGAAIAAAFV